MRLRYYSEFKSIKEKTYRVELHTKLATYSEELTLSSNPVSVEYESDSLYAPLKLSNAVVNVMTENVLKELYTGENQGVEVRLYNITDSVLEWFGYLTPNLYSSDYITVLNDVALEGIDTIASLENIKYSYIEDNGTFRTFKELVLYILNKADPNRIINKLYIQNANRLTINNAANLFDETYVHERNFFDEANEPMTCKEVIESLVKYYGMTLIQYRNAYYIIDYQYINAGNYLFTLIDRSDNSCTDIIIDSPILNVKDIGVFEANGSISLGNVYNKVSVVANRNSISDLCPDLFDDSDLINQNSDPNKYYNKEEEVRKKKHVLLTAFFKSKSNWGYLKPRIITYDSTKEVNEITDENIDTISKGTFWQKCDSYESEDGEPSSLSWQNFLTLFNDGGLITSLVDVEPYLSLKREELFLLKDGYLIVNLRFKLSPNRFGHEIIDTNDELYSNTKYGSGFKDTLFPCRLSIGDYYYNGDRWVNYSEYYDRISKNYYSVTYGPISYSGATWYSYIDQYGYRRFVTEKEYNSLSANYDKNKGGFSDSNKVYYINNSKGERVFITEDYYNECNLLDRFYLVHKNKDGDKVFGEMKSLTNTVSYKYNLADSEDGAAIKLPTNVLLQGKLKFEIYAPNQLGTIPMSRTDKFCAKCVAFHISDLVLKYTSNKETYDIFNNKDNEEDTVYTNIISDDNVTELDDIELLVNSNSKNTSSYSNTATKIGDKIDYIKSVYSPIADEDCLPEQILIDKLYSHYCRPKFKYQNTLNNGLSILSRIKENSLGKTMVVDSLGLDYANESCQVTLIEV